MLLYNVMCARRVITCAWMRPCCASNSSCMANRPSAWGMLVYRLVTSNVQSVRWGWLAGGSHSDSTFMRCGVSLIKDSWCCIIGFKKVSMYADMRSVTAPLADSMGLMAGFSRFLCILGRP
eukprot:GHVR01027409.1.p2 GENE.GHVR01027409.1~~GHVR01027409.1.p2  ORF type:complete len:121 (+),score=6.84 GHVR01027409.1:155-517(+)